MTDATTPATSKAPSTGYPKTLDGLKDKLGKSKETLAKKSADKMRTEQCVSDLEAAIAALQPVIDAYRSGWPDIKLGIKTLSDQVRCEEDKIKHDGQVSPADAAKIQEIVNGQHQKIADKQDIVTDLGGKLCGGQESCELEQAQAVYDGLLQTGTRITATIASAKDLLSQLGKDAKQSYALILEAKWRLENELDDKHAPKPDDFEAQLVNAFDDLEQKKAAVHAQEDELKEIQRQLDVAQSELADLRAKLLDTIAAEVGKVGSTETPAQTARAA